MDRLDSISASRKGFSIRVILSYIFDYAIIVALAVLYAVIDKIVVPFHQHFSLRNYTIQYPYAVNERIPIRNALFISGVFPIIVIAVYTLVIDGIFSHRRKARGYLHSYSLKERLWELNCGVLGLLLSQGAAFVITGTLKNLCGKPRPDLIARCLPREGSADPAVFGLSDISICTQSDSAILTDGFRSFPSGHSSSSFAGLFYLSLYLAGKLHVLDNRGEVWRTVIVLIPTLAASCVAMSRIMDARHHPFDVLFGSALGILVAWGSYRQYFPAVEESWRKGRAWPMRTWGKSIKAPANYEDNLAGDSRRTRDESNDSQIALTNLRGRRQEGPRDGSPAVRERVTQQPRVPVHEDDDYYQGEDTGYTSVALNAGLDVEGGVKR